VSAKFRGSPLHPGIPVSAAVSELVRSWCVKSRPRILAMQRRRRLRRRPRASTVERPTAR
jgi:hypothetical protein